QHGLEGAGEVCCDGSAGLRSVAGPAGALRHLHEQLHGANLDTRDDQRGDQGADGDLRDAPAAQAAERKLQWPGYALELRAVPVDQGAASERGRQDPDAHRELARLGSAAPGNWSWGRFPAGYENYPGRCWGADEIIQ